MKNSFKQNSGFTLIELIVVIVILGIMAAIAGPKFVDLQSEARSSVISGVEGAVRSSATLVYSKSLIEGEESIDEGCGDATCQVAVSGGNVNTKFGYPQGEAAGLEAALELEGDITTNNVDATTVRFEFGALGATCSVTYIEAASDGAAPTISSDTSGC